MRGVTKFLTMLSSAFLLYFFSFGAGVAYADDQSYNLGKPTISFVFDSQSSSPVSLSATKWYNGTDYPLTNMLFKDTGTNFLADFNVGKYGFPTGFQSFSLPISVNYNLDKKYSDFLIDIPLVYYFAYLTGDMPNSLSASSGSYYIYKPVFSFSGSAVFTFSDGSTQTFPISSTSDSISIGAKKDAATGNYIMTSEDFTLKSNDKQQFSLASSGKASFSAKTASMKSEAANLSGNQASLSSSLSSISGQFSGSGLPNSAKVNTTNQVITIPGTGSLIPPTVSVPVVSSVTFSSASFLNSTISGGSFSSGLATFASGLATFAADRINFSATGADLSVSSADVALTDGVVEESLVSLQSASPDIYPTKFSLTGNLVFQSQFLDFEGPFAYSFDDTYAGKNAWIYFLLDNRLYAGTSQSFLAHIAGTLDNIYQAVRYDIPLTLRHLIIPTTEEVSDVIEDAVDNIEQNAGGLGQAVTAVNNDIKQFQNILTSGKAGSLKIPAAVVNVNGQKYKLWEDFDVAPYFQLKPIKDVISYVVPFLEFLIAGFVIYQFYYMWISLLSGNSYFAFIRSVKELNDEE